MEDQKNITITVPTIDNIARQRTYIPTLFGIALLFFFFNFCELSCQGQKLASVTGIALATGTTIESPKMDSPFGFGEPSKKDSKDMPRNIWAIFALLAAIGGLVVFLIKHKQEDRIGVIAGATGVIALLLLQITLSSSIKKEGNGMIALSFLFPYWAALLSFGAAGTISFLRSKQNALLNPAAGAPFQPAPTSAGTDPFQNPAGQDFTPPPPRQESAPPVFQAPPPTYTPEPVAPPPPPPVQAPPTPNYSFDPPEAPRQAPPQAPVYQPFVSKEPVVQYGNNDKPRNSQNLMLGLVIGAVALIVIATVVVELSVGGSPKTSPSKGTSKLETPGKSRAENETKSSSSSSSSAAPTTEAAMSIGYVHTLKGSDLRLRSEPSESGSILMNVPNGSPVIILGYDDHESTVNGETGKWCKINFNGNVGWAWGKFISQNK